MSRPDYLAPPLTLRLFGPFEACLHGQPLPRLRSQKGQWLLALLALRAGREVERGWITATFWPDSPEAAAYANLRSTLKDLRRALGAEAGRLGSPTRRTLRLDLTGLAIDMLEFDRAIVQGDRPALERAVSLYRGPLLEGRAAEWAFEERQVREQGYLATLETLAEQALARDDPEVAAGYLRRAAAVDPLRESAQRGLMKALAAGGNYAAALVVYRELRLRLHREINVGPDAETQALFQQLRAEARQRGHGRAATVGERQRLVREGIRNEASGRTHPAVPHPSSLIPHPSPELPLFALQRALARGPIVGRAAELTTLQRQIEAAAQGYGAALFLAGEPGIGKTRLAVEASEEARRRGFRVLTGQCEEEGSAPYQPFVQAVQEYLEETEPWELAEALPPTVACELVRLVPRIGALLPEVARIPPAAGEQARGVLLEAVGEFCALLTRQTPLLLVLEDLHWADDGSLALLHHLARHGRKMRLLILGTYRDVELRPGHALERTLSALNRERLSQCLALRRLPEAGVAEMLAVILDEPLPLPPPCVPGTGPALRAPAPALLSPTPSAPPPPRNGEGESSSPSSKGGRNTALPRREDGTRLPLPLQGRGPGVRSLRLGAVSGDGGQPVLHRGGAQAPGRGRGGLPRRRRLADQAAEGVQRAGQREGDHRPATGAALGGGSGDTGAGGGGRPAVWLRGASAGERRGRRAAAESA